MVATTEPVRTSESDRAGKMLRDWRLRKGLSQLALSLQAGISARHLSFVETGRSVPSTELIVHLGEYLEIPLRERNRILLAAGHAPVYSHHRPDDPELAVVRSELSQMIAAVEPVPRSSATAIGGWSKPTGRSQCCSTDVRRTCSNRPPTSYG